MKDNCAACLGEEVEVIEGATGYSVAVARPSVFSPGVAPSYRNLPAIGPMPGIEFYKPEGLLPAPVVAHDRHVPVVVGYMDHIPVVVAGYEVIA
jgi:hypothetical protein